MQILQQISCGYNVETEQNPQQEALRHVWTYHNTMFSAALIFKLGLLYITLLYSAGYKDYSFQKANDQKRECSRECRYGCETIILARIPQQGTECCVKLHKVRWYISTMLWSTTEFWPLSLHAVCVLYFPFDLYFSFCQ